MTTIKSAAYAAAVFALTFLLVAFISWDLNPGNWHVGTRFYTALVGIMAAGCTFMATHWE